MLAVPSALQSKFDECLRIRSIPDDRHGPYQKWLSSERSLTSCEMRRLPSTRTMEGVKSSEPVDEPAISTIMLGRQVRICMN